MGFPIEARRLSWADYQSAILGSGVASMTRRSRPDGSTRNAHASARISLTDRLSGNCSGVQRKLMRHSDIRTTMNVYGDVVDDRTKEAHGKVVALVFGDRSPRKQVAKEQDSKGVV